jgi:hypothetical protein
MAGSYNVVQDFGLNADPDHLDINPYWILAVIRQGSLLTYSRKTASSIFKNLADDPIINTSHPLIISADCLSMSVTSSKRNPSDNFQATLKQTDTNYLIQIFPGDYLFAWMVNNRDKYLDLLNRIKNLKPCNKFDDGLKFVGRVEDIRKKLNIEPSVGHKTVTYSLTGTGFSELQTMFFYDYSLASNDAQKQDLGTWLARLGVDYQTLFGQAASTGIQVDNINTIIPTLLNLIVGSGPSKEGNISVPGFGGENVTATPTLANEAPYAYVIPLTVGKLLGKDKFELGKPRNVLAYADIIELIMGIQVYSKKSGISVFEPDLDTKSTPGRKVTTKPMLGTFLPYMTEFTNVPVWSLLQKYSNPTINELFTTLRVNGDGNIIPTIICRQIPFTTEAFQDDNPVKLEGPSIQGQQDIYQQKPLNVTKFLDLPRWIIPNSMIQSIDIGRSNSQRYNFIHTYGAASLMANNLSVGEQLIINPPIMDTLSVQSHGLHPYLSTVEVFVSDEVGRAPRQWMLLLADFLMGSHLTLSGTVNSFGIQAPIAVGDNFIQDGIVFHIESVSHSCGISPDGKKSFRTSLNLSNGMRDDGKVDILNSDLNDFTTEPPIYAGIAIGDNVDQDPGISLEGDRTFGGLPLSSQIPEVTSKMNDSFTNDGKDSF